MKAALTIVRIEIKDFLKLVYRDIRDILIELIAYQIQRILGSLVVEMRNKEPFNAKPCHNLEVRVGMCLMTLKT